ncbi:MAG: indole-3-glycerol phosphate synthase TrpC [Candidatus Ratteibacteria bacterium]|nr:indole-3-glycerol phosphate synthase TrpC [Candidatus Ratteibacteria bacterium]
MVSLDEILKVTHERVERAKSSLPPDELQKRCQNSPPVRSFQKALITSPTIALIGEIKKASPSAGLIREDFSPLKLAKIYLENGARALSVLTEEKFFQGKLDYLLKIRGKIELPLLRKDFIIDEYQVFESRFFGADAILLIVSVLSDEKINRLFRLARESGMEVIVEIHSEEDWRRISSLPAKLIGINNRNLKTLTTDLSTTFKLAPFISKNQVVISESGIKTREDVLNLEKAGVKGILVGETIMGSRDAAQKIRYLLGK